MLSLRLAEALARLHDQGVVHRDLKPANVLLAADGPRLIDFGIARAADATAITQTGVVVGTPPFMSPEQALGEGIGPPSDVFSLGSVLVFAMTGAGPSGVVSSPLAMLRRISDEEPDLAAVPERFRPLLEACFAKEPAARPTAAELARQLSAGVQASDSWHPTLVMTAPFAEELPAAVADRSVRVSRRLALVGTGAGLALIALPAAGASLMRRGTPGTLPEAAPPAPPTPSVQWTAPAVKWVDAVVAEKGRVFIGTGRGVRAIDTATHADSWGYDVTGPFDDPLGDDPSTLSVGDGLVFYSVQDTFHGQGPDGTLAAVKEVHAQYTADPRFRVRFSREISTARAARGNGIARLLDADPTTPGRHPWSGASHPPVPVTPATPSTPPTPTRHLPAAIASGRPWSRGLSRRAVLVGAGALAVAGAGLGGASAIGLLGGGHPVRWSFDADAAVVSVAVADGTPYAVSERGTVYALDPATGRPRWTFAMRPTPYGRLRPGPGFCFASDGAWLYALDAADGSLRWTRERTDLGAMIGSLPVGVQNTFGERAIVALDPASGAPRWTCPLPEPANTLDGAMAMTEGHVHVTLDTRVFTVDAATGTPRWERPLPADPSRFQTLAVGSTSLFTLTGRDVVRLDAASGAEAWRRQAPGYRIAAWDVATGEPRWAVDRPTSDWQIHTPPVIGDDTCYLIEQLYESTDAGCIARYRVARSSEDGGARWTAPLDRITDTQLEFSMALSDDSLFLGTTIGLSDSATGTVHAVSID